MALSKQVRKSKLVLIIVAAVAIYMVALFVFYLDIDPTDSAVTIDSSASSSTSTSKSKRGKTTIDGSDQIPQKKNLITSFFKKAGQDNDNDDENRKDNEADGDRKRKKRTSKYGGRDRSQMDSSTTTTAVMTNQQKRFPNNALSIQQSSNILTSFNRLWDETINGEWQNWNAIGFCRNDSSLIESIPHQTCARSACFYSSFTDVYVDMTKLRNISFFQQFSMISSRAYHRRGGNNHDKITEMKQFLHSISWDGDKRQCRLPSGGQLPVSEALSIQHQLRSKSTHHSNQEVSLQTSFIISLNSSDPYNIFAIDSVLEIFRTASETASAEYIVSYDIADHSHESSQQSHSTSSWFWNDIFFQNNKKDKDSKRIVQRAHPQENTASLNLLHNLKELFGISVTLFPYTPASSVTTTTTPYSSMESMEESSSPGSSFSSNHTTTLATNQLALSVAQQHATGEYAALVRYDVLVLPGWLTMLRKTMESFASSNKVGMVGPLYLDADGTILEAGGVIFRNGKAHHIGFGFQMKELSMLHARAVDFVSSSCLLIRKEILSKLPPLSYLSPILSINDRISSKSTTISQQSIMDIYFSLFIQEVLDYKIVFQPFSIAVHANTAYHRSVTLSLEPLLEDDPTKRRTRVRSTVTLTPEEEKHQKEQRKHHFEFLRNLHSKLEAFCPVPSKDAKSSMEMVRAAVGLENKDYSSTWKLHADIGASYYRDQNRILFLEDVVPETDRDAGSIRLYELLHILPELGYSVTFEPQPITGRNIRYVLPLLADGVNMVLPGTLHDMAKSAEQGSSSVALSVKGQTSICPWKVLIIARRDVFLRHYDDVQRICPNVPIIFDTVDVHFIRELRMFSLKYNTNDFSVMSLIESNSDAQREISDVLSNQQKELNAMRRSKITIVVSSEEKRLLQKIFSVQQSGSNEPISSVDVRIISNIYQVDDSEDEVAPEQREGAVFAGNMCHTPNMDAVDFIVREVLKNPERFPKGFKMHFVWSRSKMCPNPILDNALKHPLVEVHRDISNEELYELHRRVKAVLAPLRYGAGVKGKVNYGLLHGVPVVATKVASEGMGLVDGTNFLLAETGDEFVTQILRLYSDKDLFLNLAKGGKAVMKTVFGRDVAKEKIRTALVDVGASPTDSLRNGHCPFVGLHDSHGVSNWNNYWHFGDDNDGGTFFPLYPRIPYTNKAYLNHVQ